MCRGIVDANKELVESETNDFTVGSMDAISLYPSIKVEEAMAICLEMAVEAPIEFEGISWKQMMKYLKVQMPLKDITEAGLDKFLPTRYTNRGPRITLKYLQTDQIVFIFKEPVINRQEPTSQHPNEIDPDKGPPAKKKRMTRYSDYNTDEENSNVSNAENSPADSNKNSCGNSSFKQ